jgi:hypothetical protein
MRTPPNKVKEALETPPSENGQLEKTDNLRDNLPDTKGQRRSHHRPGAPRSEEKWRLTRPQAERQAETIRHYWQHRGIHAQVWVEPTLADEWTVRSALRLAVGGLR